MDEEAGVLGSSAGSDLRSLGQPPPPRLFSASVSPCVPLGD